MRRADRYAAGIHRRRHLQSLEHHLADIPGTVAGEQAQLEPDKTDGDRGANRTAHDGAAVRMQPRGYVDSKTGRTVRIGCRNRLGPWPADLAFQPGAEQRIDDQIGICRDALVWPPVTAHFFPTPGIERCIPLQTLRISQLQDLDVQPGLARKPGHHETVTAVVARAGKHGQMPRVRPAPADQVERGLSGPLHQGQAGDTEALDRQAIETPHLLRGVKGARQLIGIRQRSQGHWNPNGLSL